MRARILAHMHDLAAGVLVLALAREGDADEVGF